VQHIIVLIAFTRICIIMTQKWNT